MKKKEVARGKAEKQSIIRLLWKKNGNKMDNLEMEEMEEKDRFL